MDPMPPMAGMSAQVSLITSLSRLQCNRRSYKQMWGCSGYIHHEDGETYGLGGIRDQFIGLAELDLVHG